MPSTHLYHVPMSAPSTVASGTQTILQLATPATRRAWIKAIFISGKDTDGAKVPPLVDLMRQTNAGTGGTSVTPNPYGPGAPAALFTAKQLLTTEPTDGGVVIGGPWYVTSVGGLFSLQLPLGDEIEMNPNNFLGLRLITAGTINGVIGCMVVQE